MSSAAHYVELFRGESPETLRKAIEALDTIEPAGADQAAKIRKIRESLVQQLLDGPQGSLF